MHSTQSSPAALCTIVAKNYLAYARTLAESFAAQHPDGQMFVLLVDRPDGYFDPQAEPFTVLIAEDLPIPQFAQMAFRYSVLELSTAVKPFLLEYLIDHYQLDHIIYLDPDIYCYRPLTPLLEALQSHFIVLTPHILDPIAEDGLSPSELHILQAGVYNLGCIGVARSPQLASFLHWWQRRLEHSCVVDIGRGLFVDQRWIDLIPALFQNVAIVRDPGCNVAYWNLSNRQISYDETDQCYMVNGAPLTFYHFSGIRLDQIDQISIHQNRYTLLVLPLLRPLFLTYRESLFENGIAVTRRWPYSHSTFSNHIPIPDAAREIWRNNNGWQRWPQPFSTSESDSFFAWLNQEAHAPESPGLITNLAVEIYLRRPDVRAAFPDITTVNRRGFLNWFVHDVEWQHRISSAFVNPVRQSLEIIDAAEAERIRQAAEAAEAEAERIRQAAEVEAEAERIRQTAEAERIRQAAEAERIRQTVASRSPAWANTLYYGIRNPLRRLGIQEHVKRLIGRDRSIQIYKLLVTETPPVPEPPAPKALVIVPAPEPPAQAPAPEPPAPEPPAQAPASEAPPVLVSASANGYSPGINIIGYLEHPTGVGEVARAILRSVSASTYPTSGIDIHQHMVSGLDVTAWKYQRNLLCVNADGLPDVRRAIGLQFFRDRPTVGFWHWETSRFPQEWHDRLRMLDELWVASDFVRDSIAAISPIPVFTIPVPVTAPNQYNSQHVNISLPSGRFIWLFTFDMHSVTARKNPHGVISAFRKAFGQHSAQAHLVIKANHTEEYPTATAKLRADLASIGGTLIDRTMERGELAALFSMCDGYVSLHRSEGFGLTMAEAMALGKPVVATAYSGNMQFMNAENSFPVRYSLVEIERAYGPYPPGHQWAEPDIDHAAEMMASIVRNPEDAKQYTNRAAEDIRNQYSSEVVAKRIIERIEQVVCVPSG